MLAYGATELVAEKRREFADRNPRAGCTTRTALVLPGGNTRTVLNHPPFPLTFVRGEGATLTDADGHEYIDLLGDYTAGLFGHSDRGVLDAVDDAMRTIASVGGVHPNESAARPADVRPLRVSIGCASPTPAPRRT